MTKPRAEFLVHGDAGDRQVVPAFHRHHRERQSQPGQRGHRLALWHDHDDALDPAVAEVVDGVLQRRRGVAAHHDRGDHVALFARGGLQPGERAGGAEQRGVGRDHAEGQRAPGDEGTGRGVAPVAQLSIAWRTAARVEARTLGWSLRTRETVWCETPATMGDVRHGGGGRALSAVRDIVLRSVMGLLLALTVKPVKTGSLRGGPLPAPRPHEPAPGSGCPGRDGRPHRGREAFTVSRIVRALNGSSMRLPARPRLSRSRSSSRAATAGQVPSGPSAAQQWLIEPPWWSRRWRSRCGGGGRPVGTQRDQVDLACLREPDLHVLRAGGRGPKRTSRNGRSAAHRSARRP